jgi:hypothetical protein
MLYVQSFTLINLQAEEFHNLVLVEYQARLYKTFHWYIHIHMSVVYFRSARLTQRYNFYM